MIRSLLFTALSLVSATPCFEVRGAGLDSVNGVYQAEELPYYSGPMAYRRGSHWLYRWHQTYWYLSELKWADGDVAPAGEKEFTDPVIYSALVDENSPESPPTSGWHGDKMLGFGPPPAPIIVLHQCVGSTPIEDIEPPPKKKPCKHGVSSRVNEVYQAVGGTLALALLAIVGALLAASRCSRKPAVTPATVVDPLPEKGDAAPAPPPYTVVVVAPDGATSVAAAE